MKQLLQDLVTNESGVILSAEMVLILTIAVLGVVVGLSEITTAVVFEFQDLALAFYGLNQTYWTPSFMGCSKFFGPLSYRTGSGFFDYHFGCVGPGAFGGGFGGMGGGFGGMGGGYGGGFGGGFGGGGYGGNGGGYSYSGGAYGGYADIGMGANSLTTAPCSTCTTGGASSSSTNSQLPALSN